MSFLAIIALALGQVACPNSCPKTCPAPATTPACPVVSHTCPKACQAVTTTPACPVVSQPCPWTDCCLQDCPFFCPGNPAEGTDEIDMTEAEILADPAEDSAIETAGEANTKNTITLGFGLSGTAPSSVTIVHIKKGDNGLPHQRTQANLYWFGPIITQCELKADGDDEFEEECPHCSECVGCPVVPSAGKTTATAKVVLVQAVSQKVILVEAQEEPKGACPVAAGACTKCPGAAVATGSATKCPVTAVAAGACAKCPGAAVATGFATKCPVAAVTAGACAKCPGAAVATGSATKCPFAAVAADSCAKCPGAAIATGDCTQCPAAQGQKVLDAKSATGELVQVQAVVPVRKAESQSRRGLRRQR